LYPSQAAEFPQGEYHGVPCKCSNILKITGTWSIIAHWVKKTQERWSAYLFNSKETQCWSEPSAKVYPPTQPNLQSCCDEEEVQW